MTQNRKDSRTLAEDARAAFGRFTAAGTADSLRGLYDALFELGGALREEMQTATLQPVKDIIDKIERAVPLTPEDMQFIRLWLVGDAEAYAARENDFAAWKAELARLMDAVAEEAPRAGSVKAALDLQAAVTDALGLLPSLQRYLESADRVKRFENATARLDGATMLAIRNLLESKIKSPND
jgi:hypothetical protein